MQKLDLAKYKELLGLEENALEQELELSSYKAEGRGKESLSENLNKQLPYLFHDFQEIEALDKEIKKAQHNVIKGKARREYFINGPKKKKAAVGIAEGVAYYFTIPRIINMFYPTYLRSSSELESYLITQTLIPGLFVGWVTIGVWSALSPLFQDEDSPYIGPAGCAKALVDRATLKARSNHKISKLAREKAKLKMGLKPKIALAKAGKLEYTEEWLEKQRESLEEMLGTAHYGFTEQFEELQKIIKAEDTLKLLKYFEEFSKNMEKEPWGDEGRIKQLRKFELTKMAGIWVKDTKKTFKKELEERKKHFDLLIKPTKKAPKNPKKQKLIEQIEEIASLEYHFQKYPSIKNNKKKKEKLRELYKQRPKLLWTAKKGELERITGEDERPTRLESACQATCVISALGTIITLLTPLSEPIYCLVNGWILSANHALESLSIWDFAPMLGFTAAMFASMKIHNRRNELKREIRRYLRTD